MGQLATAGKRKQNLNIALYFFKLGGASGGAERMICRLANALDDLGFQVTLISWDDPSASALFPLGPNINWKRLGFAPGWRDKLRRTRSLKRVLASEAIDVLIGFVMSGDKTVYAASWLTGTKIIAAERNGPSLYHHRYNAVQRTTMKILLHFVAKIVVQFPRFQCGYPRSLTDRIVAIPNPVPKVSGRASPDGTAPDGWRTLLFAGRLDELQKRPLLLVDAFVDVMDAHPEWRLRIVGDGPDRADVCDKVAALGAGNRIAVEPATTKIFEAYRDAQLFVTPSVWEGFPNALAEAMAHGLPAVGFEKAEGVADLIGSDSGWLVGRGAPKSQLAQTLGEAMGDHKGRASRGRKARERVAAFSEDGIFKQWERLLWTV